MAAITRYEIRNADDDPWSPWTYRTYDDAYRAVKRADEPVAIIELEFEYSDSSLVWTYDGSETWPPAPCEVCAEHHPPGTNGCFAEIGGEG